MTDLAATRPADPSLQTVTRPDGRTLAFAEWGDPGGVPIVSLHGTPGCRLGRHPDPGKYVEAGARVITYDRPGYGRSDRHAGRVVADCAGGVAAIADSLGIDRFAVVGGSGGGPHALAVAALLGERVLRARCVVGIAPYGAEGLDFLAGMDPNNVTEFGWALAGDAVLVPNLEAELAAMGERVAADPSKILGDDWDLAEADRAVLGRADMGAVIRASTAEIVRGGVWGWVDDDLAFTRPWGFDLASVAVPVEVRYGTEDVLVPAAHGAWLAARVPGARAVVEPGQGHLSDPDRILETLHWLVHGDD
jgi:pimeloyl-ACP methyl ester carboxylesterase